MTYLAINDCDHAVLQVLQGNLVPSAVPAWFDQWLQLSKSHRGLYDSIVAFADMLDDAQDVQSCAWLRVLLLDAVMHAGQRTPANNTALVVQ
jgi:hypothetical protein